MLDDLPGHIAGTQLFFPTAVMCPSADKSHIHVTVFARLRLSHMASE